MFKNEDNGPSMEGPNAAVNIANRRNYVRENLFTPLLLDEVTQLALHRLKGVVDHFVEWIVRAVVHLPFIGNELVSTRDRDIDADAELISFMMGVVRLLDCHVAAVDMVAKFFQPRRFFQDETFDLVRFFQTPISDLNR